jgi:hypothetical protein
MKIRNTKLEMRNYFKTRMIIKVELSLFPPVGVRYPRSA